MKEIPAGIHDGTPYRQCVTKELQLSEAEHLQVQIERLRDLNAMLNAEVDRLAGAVVDLYKQTRQLDSADWLP